ncbi:hypothetical protein ACH5RR_030248 [Cinchona calisaya]|uniref:Uncharacterized protein n=1 Tax=Cinchona calisaya TaxID=153742 RepID=A0ABD2YXB0_9GENT
MLKNVQKTDIPIMQNLYNKHLTPALHCFNEDAITTGQATTKTDTYQHGYFNLWKPGSGLDYSSHRLSSPEEDIGLLKNKKLLYLDTGIALKLSNLTQRKKLTPSNTSLTPSRSHIDFELNPFGTASLAAAPLSSPVGGCWTPDSFGLRLSIPLFCENFKSLSWNISGESLIARNIASPTKSDAMGILHKQISIYLRNQKYQSLADLHLRGGPRDFLCCLFPEDISQRALVATQPQPLQDTTVVHPQPDRGYSCDKFVKGKLPEVDLTKISIYDTSCNTKVLNNLEVAFRALCTHP